MEARGSPLLRGNGFFMDDGGARECWKPNAALPAGPLDVRALRCELIALAGEGYGRQIDESMCSKTELMSVQCASCLDIGGNDDDCLHPTL